MSAAEAPQLVSGRFSAVRWVRCGAPVVHHDWNVKEAQALTKTTHNPVFVGTSSQGEAVTTTNIYSNNFQTPLTAVGGSGNAQIQGQTENWVFDVRRIHGSQCH
jgi:hypothetical protein